MDVETLLSLYRRGVFPMAQARDDFETFLVDPPWRGILPLHPFHAPSRLLRTMRGSSLRISCDAAFEAVIGACAAPGPNREDTWINAPILNSYRQLHHHGHAHSIECWRADRLVGGLYGVAVGGAFFGESMFAHEKDASKIALVALAARLQAGGFSLLDAQFWTTHLAQFRAQEISRAAFLARLKLALTEEADFFRLGTSLSPAQLAQEITQTS